MKNRKTKSSIKDVDKNIAGNLSISPKKLKLEKYDAKQKVKGGQYISIFGATGDVKLLKTKQLMPSNSPVPLVFPGFANRLIETFDPQYGYGPSPVAGRFRFRHYNGSEVNYFGWFLQTEGDTDQEIDFILRMGAWGGAEPSPIQNYAILAVHVTYTPPGARSTFVPPTLTISVNSAEVDYQFIGAGYEIVLLYINKPANSNHVRINIKFKLTENAGRTGLYINRIDRYTSILSPLPDDLGTLGE